MILGFGNNYGTVFNLTSPVSTFVNILDEISSLNKILDKAKTSFVVVVVVVLVVVVVVVVVVVCHCRCSCFQLTGDCNY